MAEVERPYSVLAYNEIPDLHSATESFNANDGMEFVNKVFGPLVLKYGLEAQLGIALLHRHFRLEEAEKLVEFNNVSVPWKLRDQSDTPSGGKILPNSWLLKDGKLMPYEFFFSPLAKDKSVDLAHDKVQAFLEEFIKAANFSKLDQIIALRMFPGKGFRGGLEFTEHRANIVLEPDQYEQEPNSAVDVTWYFEPGYLQAGRRCSCVEMGQNYHCHTK